MEIDRLWLLFLILAAFVAGFLVAGLGDIRFSSRRRNSHVLLFLLISLFLAHFLFPNLLFGEPKTSTSVRPTISLGKGTPSLPPRISHETGDERGSHHGHDHQHGHVHEEEEEGGRIPGNRKDENNQGNLEIYESNQESQENEEEQKAFQDEIDLSSLTPIQRKTFERILAYEKEDPDFFKRFPDTKERWLKMPKNHWEILFEYPSYYAPIPKFVDQGHRQSFLTNQFIRELPNAPNKRGCIKMEGEYYQAAGFALVDDAVFNRMPECYWKSMPSDFFQGMSKTGATKIEAATLIYAPESNSFQHFMDGALPKIAQLWPLVKDFKVLTLNFHQNNIIQDIIKFLEIDAVEFNQGSTYHVEHFLFGCRAPGVNPLLFQRIHYIVTERMTRAINAQEGAPEPKRQGQMKIVYLPRGSDARNGRPLENENDVIAALRGFAQQEGHEFLELVPKELGYDLKKMITNLRETDILVGAHGGAFYNMVFSPMRATIIEFMPSHHTFLIVHNIFWTISTLLENVYYRIYYDDRVDVNLVLEAVTRAVAERTDPEFLDSRQCDD